MSRIENHLRVFGQIFNVVADGLPHRWRSAFVDAYEDGQDVHALRRSVSSLKATITATDDELRAHADAAAKLCSMQATYGDKGGALACAHRVAVRHGVPVERLPYDEPLTYLRMTDSRWWLLNIRRAHAITMESGAIRLGLVHRFTGGDCYVSRESVERQRQQDRRNRAMLEATDVVNEGTGEVMSLATIADRSISNRSVRRGELMTRIRGLELVATDLKHVGLFATITCPSRMHRYTGTKFYQRNPRYDGTNPKEAQAYLCGVWARIRAALGRLGITQYGFRVVEPHHDGCPHWHMLLWFADREARKTAGAIMRQYALQDSPDERGATKHRVTLKNIWKGGAASYVAKYIAKSTDGYGIEKDLLGNDIIEANEAVVTWARRFGIRQFQPIGGVPIGVWRELRRVDASQVEAGSLMARAVACVNKGDDGRVDFAGFVKLCGGALVRRRDVPIFLVRREEVRATRYGVKKLLRVSGVGANGHAVETRPFNWVTRRKGQGSFLRDTRTRVNNCTEMRKENGCLQSSGGEPVALSDSGPIGVHHSGGFGDDGSPVVHDRRDFAGVWRGGGGLMDARRGIPSRWRLNERGEYV